MKKIVLFLGLMLALTGFTGNAYAHPAAHHHKQHKAHHHTKHHTKPHHKKASHKKHKTHKTHKAHKKGHKKSSKSKSKSKGNSSKIVISTSNKPTPKYYPTYVVGWKYNYNTTNKTWLDFKSVP